MGKYELTTGAILYLLFVTALLGLVMGSFCNAWGWRIANGEKISRGRSHCTSCGHVLVAKDLIPLISWLTLKGKCRYCGAKISARYPVTEAISMAYYLTVLWVYGWSLDTIRFLALGSLLLVSSLVDLDTMELPDGLTIAMAVLALLRLFSDVSLWKNMLFGVLFIAIPLLLIVLLFDKIKRMETMGGGDIKLIAALGLHFGPLGTLFLLLVSCIVGLIAGAVRKKGMGKPFPFGPSIAIAAWVSALFAETAVNAYLSLF